MGKLAEVGKSALSVVHATGVPEIMDIRQCSGYLSVSPDTLYNYAMEGFIPAFKLGNRWRFKKSIVDAWIEKQCEQAEKEFPAS